MDMTKLGIMGGTFNPIHNGHIEIARIARQTAGLDEVLFLPDGEPPHKRHMLIEKLREYLNAICSDDELTTSILKIGDGVAVSVKL